MHNLFIQYTKMEVNKCYKHNINIHVCWIDIESP